MNRSSSTYSKTSSNISSYGDSDHPSFTGKETDCETGFSYFGARYYDPTLLTSWTAVDPMSDKYPSLSPYNYCAWNPMKLIDPDGRKIWLPNCGNEYTPNMDCSNLDEIDRSIASALNYFCKSEEGLLMLSVICEHDNDVNFFVNIGETHNEAVGPDESFCHDGQPGTGKDISIDIYWNLSNPEAVPTLNGMVRDATYNLLDEMCHTYDYCIGWGTKEKFDNNCSKSEFQAVYRSNIVRHQLGDYNYRSQYYTTPDDKSGIGPHTARTGEIYRPCWYPKAETDNFSTPIEY